MLTFTLITVRYVPVGVLKFNENLMHTNERMQISSDERMPGSQGMKCPVILQNSSQTKVAL